MKKITIIILILVFLLVGVVSAYLIGRFLVGDNRPPITFPRNGERPGAGLILSNKNLLSGLTGADEQDSKIYPDILFSVPVEAKIFMPFEWGILDSGTSEVEGVKLELIVLKDKNSTRELYFMAHDFAMGIPDTYKKGEEVARVNSDKPLSATYPKHNLIVFPDDDWYARVVNHPQDPVDYLKLLFSIE